MPSEPDAITKILLKEVRSGDSYERLVACIDESGDLVLEGQDMGPRVEAVWGDTDYEYWVRVSKAHIGVVLLHLLRDTFDSDSAFRAWLDKRGIPYKFFNYA